MKRNMLVMVAALMTISLTAKVKEIKSANDLKTGIVLAKFFGTWCPPCKKMKPVFESLSNENKYSNITFIEVDADKNAELLQQYNVSGLPTFVLFQNGKEVSRASGADESAVRGLLDSVSTKAPKQTEGAKESKPATKAPTTTQKTQYSSF